MFRILALFLSLLFSILHCVIITRNNGLRHLEIPRTSESVASGWSEEVSAIFLLLKLSWLKVR